MGRKDVRVSKPGAIILCGGQALRLRPHTDDRPKALVDLGGITFVDYQLDWLSRHGITDVVLACGYQWERLKAHLGSRVKYSVEAEPLGTAGAARQALSQLNDSSSFVLVNGDNISDVDLHQVIAQGPESIVLTQFQCPYGVWQDQGHFVEKPLLPYWINTGIYYFSQKTLDHPGSSLEIDIFPKIALKPYRHSGFWKTVDTSKDLKEVREWLQAQSQGTAKTVATAQP